MGLFSWTCASTNLPVLAGTSFGGHPMTHVEMRHRVGDRLDRIRGTYDGYGRIDGMDVRSRMLREGAFMLLPAYAADVPEDFHGVSERDPAQGHFVSAEVVEFLARRGSMPSVAAYELLVDGSIGVETAETLDDDVFLDLAAVVAKVREEWRSKQLDCPRFVFSSYDPNMASFTVTDEVDDGHSRKIFVRNARWSHAASPGARR